MLTAFKVNRISRDGASKISWASPGIARSLIGVCRYQVLREHFAGFSHTAYLKIDPIVAVDGGGRF